MGHTTIQTTLIYVHLASTDLFVGADILDQVSPTVSGGSTNVVTLGQNDGTNGTKYSLSQRLRVNHSNAEWTTNAGVMEW